MIVTKNESERSSMYETFGSTSRIQQLKSNLISKACYGGKYAQGIYVDLTRAKLFMEGDIQFSNESPVIARAKTLKYVLANIPISILDQELIVGNPHSDPCALPIFPEVNVGLLLEAKEDGYVREADIDIATELIKYWTGRTLASKVEKHLDAVMRDIVNTASSFISITFKEGIQHCVPNWDYLFGNGTEEIRQKIHTKLDEVCNVINYENSTKIPELIKTKDLFEAMLISLDGVEEFTLRFSNLAKKMAETTEDQTRAIELNDISAACARALRYPPQTFQEACQGFYFIYLILCCIDSCAFGSLCRLDQCLWPAFEKDVIINKVTTTEQAQEIIENLILKVQGLGGFFSRKRRLHFEGNGALPIWTVGGVHKDGSDACNELTDTILRAARSVHCNQPTISILYHDKISQSALEETIKTIRTGLGYPSITNLNWGIKSLLRQGMTVEDARNSGVVGCVSLCPVDSCNTTKRLALEIITGKVLELAMNEGKCLLTGKQLGPKERPANQFKSYDELLAALRKQMEFACRSAVNVRNIARHYEIIHRPNPLASALHSSPLETGQDVVSYEDRPNNYWLNLIGTINVVNSLAVMKKLVFEQNKYNMDDMLTAMRTNWHNLEPMRQEVINKVAKYGNDDPYVDDIAKDVFNMCSDVADHTYDINGGFWSVLAQSVSIYQATAKMSGALPDGKKEGFPYADGGISPDHGTDKNGIFSVLSSAGNIEHFNTKGLLLNQWLAPEVLEGQDGIERMKSILKLFSEKGLSQMQFNVVDSNVLLDAQKYPEKYPNLTIRVSGYTANWVKLSKELQDMILARTQQRLCF